MTDGYLPPALLSSDHELDETPEARDFYGHLIPQFEPSPTDELHLVLMMKDILRSLRS